MALHIYRKKNAIDIEGSALPWVDSLCLYFRCTNFLAFLTLSSSPIILYKMETKLSHRGVEEINYKKISLQIQNYQK
jgi:hypothetical protein